jgi:biopolymer transport protein ExbB
MSWNLCRVGAAAVLALLMSAAATAAQSNRDMPPGASSGSAHRDGTPAGSAHRVSAFERYVLGGGWVTMGLLIPISIIALSLVIQNMIKTRQEMTGSTAALQRLSDLVRKGDYAEAVRDSAADRSIMGYVLHSGFQSAPHGTAAMRRAMEQALDERAVSLLRRLEYVSLIGHVAPMVGLFGTVHGIIGMFGSIAEEGGIPVMANISHDLGAALVATFWGLMIAVPSLAAFGIMRGKADILLQQCSMGIDAIMRQLHRKPARAGGHQENSPG